MISFRPQSWKRTFFLIWSGQALSLVGSGLVQFALVWWLTQKTGSAAVLASASLAAILPEVVLGPFAGALVDRLNRKTVMILADTANAAAILALAVLFATGLVQPWHIFLILFARSIGGIFHWPAMQASTSLMVPKEQLGRIAGLNQLLRGIITIGAPPLGALLFSLLPMAGILAIDVVTALLAVVPLALVAIPQPAREGAAEIITPRRLLLDVREGLRYVAARPGLVALLVMAMVINFLFNPAGMLMPLLVTNHFSGNAWHLSLIESGWGIGMIAGSLLLSAWGGFKRQVFTCMTGLIGMGVGALMIGLAPGTAFFLAVAANTLAGVFNPICNGPVLALLQTRVEPSIQGRVFTLVSSGCAAMMPLGMILAAPVADLLGIQFWFITAGVVTAGMGVAGFFLPVITRLESDLPPISQPGAPVLQPAAE
jgi:DHA3 family macrolide efflux protein-like MFS transporter